MTVSDAYRARNHAAILRAAARLFRQHGYGGVNVDRIMAEAGLTRGTFYTYFKSKQALFTEAIGFEPDFRRRLSERPAGDLATEAAAIASDYLDPAHRHLTWAGCALASLSQDATRARQPETRHAFAAVVKDLTTEFARGLPDTAEGQMRARQAVIMAIGGLTLAQACEGTPLGDLLAEAANLGVSDLLCR